MKQTEGSGSYSSSFFKNTLKKIVFGSIEEKDLHKILIARGLMSASRALAGVLVPVYFVLLGFRATSLGALFMGIAFAAVALSFSVGVLSDASGPKPFLIMFPLMVTLASVVFAFTTNKLALIVVAMVASYGRGAGAGVGQIGPYQPAESSLVVSAVSAKERNNAFSRVTMFSTFGALVGSLLALASRSNPGSRSFVMDEFRFSMLIIGTLSLFAALVVFPITNHKREVQSQSLLGSPLPQSAKALVLRLWATNTLNGLSVGLYGPFITYWFYIRYGVSTATIGVLYSGVNIAALSSGLIAPKLAKRYGLIRATVLLRVAQALMLIPWAISPTFVLAGVFYTARMIFQRASFPLRQSYAIGLAPEGSKARVSSISNIPSQVAMAVSPVAAGVIYDSVSLELPFFLGAVLQLASSYLYYIFFKDRPPVEEQSEDPL